MLIVAKTLEAIGILCVFAGLILGINSPTLWIELYLTIIGVAIFLVGWMIEKYRAWKLERKSASRPTT